MGKRVLLPEMQILESSLGLILQTHGRKSNGRDWRRGHKGQTMSPPIFLGEDMKVELIDYSQNAFSNIVKAGRTCYRSQKEVPNYENDLNLVRSLIKNEHLTPIEFGWTYWHISGISRNCANQLNRYRMSSQAQESMRYVNVQENEFIYPVSALKASDACVDIVNTCKEFYGKLVAAGVPKEDARYFLPMGMSTTLNLACNFRELRHILEQRLDPHAQWEVRAVALEMLAICREKWPWLVEDIDEGN